MYSQNDALLVIDLQPDFMPGGALPVAGGDEIVSPIVEMVRQSPGTVVYTQDWHPARHKSFASSHEGKKPYDEITMYGKPQTLWPDHCVSGTPGAELAAALPRGAASLILRKGMDPAVDSYSAFNENYGPNGVRRSTGLLGMLLERGVRRVFICGLARDFCVLWSAQDSGMVVPTFVIWDLTRAVFPANDDETRTAMRRASVNVV